MRRNRKGTWKVIEVGRGGGGGRGGRGEGRNPKL